MARKKWMKRAASVGLAMALLAGSVAMPDMGNEIVWAAEENTSVINPSMVDDATNLVTNGDFEQGTDGWEISMPEKDDNTVGFKVKTDEWAVNNKTNFLNIWNNSENDVTFSMKQTISDVPAGNYKLAFRQEGAEMVSGLTVSVNGTEKALDATTGWDNWADAESDVFTMEQSGDVTISFSGVVKAGYWGDLDDIVLYRDGALEEDTTVVNDELTVKKVENLSDDFIMGMDISSIISEFESGVTFKDYEGNTIDNVTDFCKLLAENGVTHIRVRVWNDPYDADGNGYGGGNNDVEKAKQIADACRASGLKMLVDFHCSDFWADPSKQQAPKAWAELTLDEKKAALFEFLTESLNTIDPEKDTVAMVQVGNETTGGFVGEKGTENMCTMFSAGADAVHSYNADTKVVIHVTNPEKGNVTNWAKNLDTYDVDYDILATSYYPYWHGTLDNLKSEFETVKSTYGKDVMVAETSYAYTLNDSDGHNNTVRIGNNDDAATTTEPFTVQGQATSIRNLINAVNEAGGLGVFYWEPAWITVGDTTGLTGDAYDKQVDENQAKWEEYGSGWAASFGGDYDPNDAGKWYGGSAVDNEAMFYADGTPTAGLRVWNYVKTGAYTDNASVEKIDGADQTLLQGEAFVLPETVTVVYSEGNEMQEKVSDPVVWNTENIDTTKEGTYDVTGTVTFSKEVTRGAYKGQKTAEVHCTLTVKKTNLITEADDAGFEKADNFTTDNASVVDNVSSTKDDKKSGNACAHWYNGNAEEQTAVITYTKPVALEAGEYTFEYSAQGMDKDHVSARVVDASGDVIETGEEAELCGWKNWQTPSVTFTLSKKTDVTLQIVIRSQAGGWGTADELYLYQVRAAESEPETPGDADKDDSNKDNNSGSGTDKNNGGNTGNTGNGSDKNNGGNTGNTGSGSANNGGSTGNGASTVGKTDDGTGSSAGTNNGSAGTTEAASGKTNGKSNTLSAGSVITSGTDSSVSLKDTNGILSENAKLSSKKVTDKQVTDRVDKLVKKAVSGAKDLVVYEFNLTDGTTELHQLDGKVQVTMNIPFTLVENEAVRVYRVDGENLVECKAAIENGKLVFVTDHFSTYAFVKVNTAFASNTKDVNTASASNTKDVNTGDNTNAAIFLMIAAAGIVCLYIARRKYTR